MNKASQSQDDLLAGDLAGAESPKNINNVLAGAYSKGNFGSPHKFKVGSDPDPTKEKLEADAKIKANPEYSVDSKLPAGSSTLGGETTGYAPKTRVEGNFSASNITSGVGTDKKGVSTGKRVVGSSDFSKTGTGGQNQEYVNKALTSTKGLSYQSKDATSRSNFVQELTSMTPSTATKALSAKQKEISSAPYDSSSTGDKSFTRGEYNTANPSQYNQEKSLQDLKIKSYTKPPTSTTSGGEPLENKKKDGGILKVGAFKLKMQK